MAISAEKEKASKANFKLFIDSLGDPTFPITQANYSALLDWLRSQGSIDAIYENGGQHVFSAAYVACRAAGTLTFRPAPSDPKAYQPSNPWKEGNKPTKGGRYNKENLNPMSEDADALSDFFKGMKNLNKYLNTPNSPAVTEKSVIRQFPVNISRKDLEAANPTKAELKLLDKQQREAAAAAKDQE